MFVFVAWATAGSPDFDVPDGTVVEPDDEVELPPQAAATTATTARLKRANTGTGRAVRTGEG
jgi:hypothetical protein